MPGRRLSYARRSSERESCATRASTSCGRLTADNVYEYATDTFAVRDGKIAVQSFAGKIVPKR